MEQDLESPHRYFSENVKVRDSENVFDCGGAEGNFLLEIIENVNKAVIIECDDEWIEALERTFKPWKEKVQVFKGFVGDGTSGVKLDSIAEQTGIYPTLIKMDIEGAEVSVLNGGISHIVSKSNNLRMLVCTYHNTDDYDEIVKIASPNFVIETSKGYMYYNDEFRKTVVRLTRK